MVVSDRLPVPCVHDFRRLFKPPPGGQANAPRGFPTGSTLLVTGRPGAGKSYFALSLVREQIGSFLREQGKDSPPVHSTVRLVYIAVGASEQDLQERYRAFGWFGEADRRCIRLSVISVDETSLPQPAAGAEEVLHPILTKLRRYADDARETSEVRKARGQNPDRQRAGRSRSSPGTAC